MKGTIRLAWLVLLALYAVIAAIQYARAGKPPADIILHVVGDEVILGFVLFIGFGLLGRLYDRL